MVQEETINKIQWEGPEYEHSPKSQGWFWALGIIVTAGSAAAMMYGNYFFGAVLILSGICLTIFSIRKPNIIKFEIDEKGVKSRNDLYPWAKIKAFHMPEDGEKIFLKVEKSFAPVIWMPIDPSMGGKIAEFMKNKNIPEEKMDKSNSEKIMDMIGF